ncbi:hypothetical protein Q5752_002774 [Cryptotrichosporon argae]
MGLFSWFTRREADYETVLARLATEVAEAKTRLAEIRLRERRFSLLVILYGLGLWGAWVGLWWFGGLPWGLIGWSTDDVEVRVAGAAGVGGGPVVIYLLNRVVHLIFTRLRASEETHLRLLLAKQRKQVDEIKKATNYDSTRKLIEQYDEANAGRFGTPQLVGSPHTPKRQPPPPQPQLTGPAGTPRAPGHLAGAGGTPAQPGAVPGTPVAIPEGLTADQAAALHMHMQSIQPVLPTPEKRWYDRLADSILGDDPSQAAHSKYALVCENCFRHNGLVGSKQEWERMKWICPRCNHLNAAPASRPASGAPSRADPTLTPTPAPKPALTPAPPSPATPSHTHTPTPALASASAQSPHLRASPRPRRHPSERATPRSSRLGQEMFSAGSEDEEDGAMELDQ